MATQRFSGERKRNRPVIFGVPERFEAPDRNFFGARDILVESLARYHFVAPYLHGGVLDVGCGRGYGFEFIQSDKFRVGVDISFEFIYEARANFPNIPFLCATGPMLPFENNSFDSVLAFEVIEHIEDDHAFLRQLRSLLRNNGFLAISTPNKRATSGTASKPLNPFHIREYCEADFSNLVGRVFSDFTIIGQTERASSTSNTNKLIDRIPIRLKYLLPQHVQSMISVKLRPPLKIEDCRFDQDNLGNAHTFIALCRA